MLGIKVAIAGSFTVRKEAAPLCNWQAVFWGYRRMHSTLTTWQLKNYLTSLSPIHVLTNQLLPQLASEANHVQTDMAVTSLPFLRLYGIHLEFSTYPCLRQAVPVHIFLVWSRRKENQSWGCCFCKPSNIIQNTLCWSLLAVWTVSWFCFCLCFSFKRAFHGHLHQGPVLSILRVRQQPLVCLCACSQACSLPFLCVTNNDYQAWQRRCNNRVEGTDNRAFLAQSSKFIWICQHPPVGRAMECRKVDTNPEFAGTFAAHGNSSYF